MTHEDYCVFKEMVRIYEERMIRDGHDRQLLRMARMCVHKYELARARRERKEEGK